jgi:hypothetical protein
MKWIGNALCNPFLGIAQGLERKPGTLKYEKHIVLED